LLEILRLIFRNKTAKRKNRRTMNIVFNALHTGMADTGGCQSIGESAAVLRDMGHTVSIVTEKNHAKHHKYETIPELPECDLCIGISTADIGSTRKAKATTKALWIRGAEWAFGVPWFPNRHEFIHKLKKFVDVGGKVLCNSEWLTERLGRYGFTAKTCYVGLDFDFYQDKGVRKPPTVGTLYSKRKSKHYCEFRQLQPYLQSFGMGYKTLGLTRDAAGSPVERFIHGDELVNFYNACTIWFTPSRLEGFHRVPAEAALCGCLVVGHDQSRGGTDDWLIKNETGYRYRTVDAAAHFIRDLDETNRLRMVANAKRILAEKIGTKQRCMRKLLEAIYDD